jgi:hypothetical protein
MTNNPKLILRIFWKFPTLLYAEALEGNTLEELSSQFSKLMFPIERATELFLNANKISQAFFSQK